MTKLTDDQTQMIQDMLCKLSEELNDKTNKPILLAWACCNDDEHIAGVTQLESFGWGNACKAIVSIAGTIHSYYGNSPYPAEDLPPLSPEESNYYSNLPDET